MTYTYEFWQENCGKSGEQIAREQGKDGGTMRRIIRAAKTEYPDLDWYGGTPEPPKVRRGIAVYDLHHPRHNKRLWQNILKFTEDFDPDIFVFGGDNEDLEVVSHWVGNRRRKIEGKRLKKDYDDFNREVLAPLDATLSADAERHFLLGNHEAWVEQYIDEHPEVEGFFEIRNNLNLDGWNVYDYGEVAKVGHLHFIHGAYINVHNAYKTAQVYGRSMVYGHGHSYQAHTLTTPLDSLPYAAVQLPCACDLNPHYRLNQPNSWVNGLGVFYVHPDGHYSLYPVIAIDGTFLAPDGTFYG